MSDIVERLRNRAETMNGSFVVSMHDRTKVFGLYNRVAAELDDQAADEITRLRADYLKLAQHISPGMDEAEIFSHTPEQVIDWGLQLRQTALAEERKRALETAAAYHDRKAGNFHALCAIVPSERAYEMVRQHQLHAAALRSLMEKPE